MWETIETLLKSEKRIGYSKSRCLEAKFLTCMGITRTVSALRGASQWFVSLKIET
jgi:hypothetical protein